jgi:hypothetical protein
LIPWRDSNHPPGLSGRLHPRSEVRRFRGPL